MTPVTTRSAPWRVLPLRPNCTYIGRSVRRSGVRTTEYLHRAVAAQVLGRPLDRSEHVHHIDGNGLNNEPGNLLIVSPCEHRAIHSASCDKIELVGLSQADLRLIDAAARRSGLTHWQFALSAAIERARTVLAGRATLETPAA